MILAAIQATGGSHGLPQLNHETYASQLFWLLLTFAFLYTLMAGMIIPRIRDVLGKRQHQIQHDLDAAEKAKNEAESAKAAYELELATAKEKANNLIQQTQKDIDNFMADEHEKLSVTLDAMLEDSEQSIAAQRAEAHSQIAPMVETLTAQIAESLLGKAPSKDAVKKSIADTQGAG